MDYSNTFGPCSICRSTRYKVTDAGFLVCEHGHQSQTFRDERDDEEGLLLGRRIKKPRTLSSSQIFLRSTQTDAAVLDAVRLGDVEKFNLLLALQHVLKAQCEAVQRALDLDPRVEQIVKSIWLMLISTVNIEYDEEQVAVSSNIDGKSFNSDSKSINSEIKNSSPKKDTIIDRRKDNVDADTDTSTDTDIDIFAKDPFLEQTEIPLTLASQPFSRDVQSKRIVPLRGRKILPIRAFTVKTTLAVLYLGLIQANIPILASDLINMVVARTVPYDNLQSILPPALFDQVRSRRYGSVFTAKNLNVPSRAKLMAMARAVAFQLLPTGYQSGPWNATGILNRMCSELAIKTSTSIPSMVARMMDNLQIPCRFFDHSCADPEMAIAAALIIFLNAHYALDNVAMLGFADEQLRAALPLGPLQWPSTRQLLTAWRAKRKSAFEFPRDRFFDWSRLNDYLRFCDSLGMRRAKGSTGSMDNRPGSAGTIDLVPSRIVVPSQTVVPFQSTVSSQIVVSPRMNTAASQVSPRMSTTFSQVSPPLPLSDSQPMAFDSNLLKRIHKWWSNLDPSLPPTTEPFKLLLAILGDFLDVPQPDPPISPFIPVIRHILAHAVDL